MSATSESGYAPTFTAAIRQVAKAQWFEYEERRRRDLGIPMTAPIEAWQVWNADPTDGDLLVPSTESDRPTGVVYTKLFPEQSEIHRFITFRPTLVISNSLSHSQGRALVCPLTKKQHHRHGDVAIEATPRRRAGSILSTRLRSVDADLDAPLNERELLCVNSSLEDHYREPIRQAVSDFLSGKWTAQHVCRPGAIVQLSKYPDYKGLVLATGALFRDPNANVALLTLNLTAEEADDALKLANGNAGTAGICNIDWTDINGDAQSDVFDVLGIQSALCGDVEVIGTTTSLQIVQRLLFEFLAEP